MAGLNLKVMGGGSVANGSSGFSPTVSTNASASAKAFGASYTAPGAPSTGQALMPNDPFGITFWAGVIATGLLLFIRHSLPG
jgi:hypothetical protein